LTPLQYMRRYGAFDISRKIGPLYEEPVPAEQLQEIAEDLFGRVYTRAPAPAPLNIAPTGAPDPDDDGRRAAGVRVDGEVLRGFPTPSGRLEFYSSTLAQWGWEEYAIPTYIRSHVHPDNLEPDQHPLISTFRLPVQIHTRSANAKWLDEIAHTNPLWIHPKDAERLGIARTGDLARVETETGYFVVKAWITEGIRPGVVACSHHMGRWKPSTEEGQRIGMSTVALENEGSEWSIRIEKGGGPFKSSDPDTMRVWWTDLGVHQNLTHAVHPDPISGMHCWHQAVRVRPAETGDRHGDVSVDTDKGYAAYKKWLEMTRPAHLHSPDGTRRPYWMLRPVRPERAAYDLPAAEDPAGV